MDTVGKKVGGLSQKGPSRSVRSSKGVQVQLPAMGSWAHLMAGATGGITTACLTSPLDVLRTRLQSGFYYPPSSLPAAQHPLPSFYRSSLVHFRQTLQILFSIHRLEGWRSLFKGLGPSLTGVVPATGIKFYTYGNCKQLVPPLFGCEKDATIVHVLSAASAGIVTGTATNPIWLVKTRLQLDSTAREGAGGLRASRYKNSIDCVRQVVRQEGIRGLYRGLGASYLGVIETTLHLTTYERLKGALAEMQKDVRDTNGWGQAAAGFALSSAAGLSKLLAVLIAYPHEVLRTRLRQSPMADGRPKYTGIIQCVRLMCREEGVVALYGGLTAHLLRTVPSAVITLGTYELVLRVLAE
ncbi:hypothetical protein AJ79_02120 [Helicocarpus griseus UAMH5409]|uniref:Mitochondrial thiamine pyrophosphate carrier 1 n=1 Tax=Helicocarpus griseus UAMH5409 TaxID=1447875 RepID=A0A2B7Y4K5_9EURO|nr:hypothetical protein AJ79_02120 [Helicocarpus griseus UAMH5409]